MDSTQPVAPREGLAILRVWREEATAELRARVTTVDDVVAGSAGAREWTGLGTEAALGELRAWLERWDVRA